jgi:L-threonylcarbamoyladenylate synthase
MNRPASNPEVLCTDTPDCFAAAVARAADALRAGEVVAVPTETVYGLAANAWNPLAVARIFAVKGRPAHNPIIVHVADLALARHCVSGWPQAAARLARAFWPGPLTLVLPRSADIPDLVTAGGPTVAVRWPAHPFMQALIRACGFPLAAPSANVSNRLSPTSAEHVRNSLGDRVSLIVDGGPCQVGLESTVIDLTTTPPRVLRPGMIHAGALAAVLGEVNSAGEEATGAALRSPGRLPRHYAPRTRLKVLAWADDAELRHRLLDHRLSPAKTLVVAHSRVPAPGSLLGVSVIPHDAEAFARALYAELHRCDEQGAEVIVVEAVPSTPEWAAVADRLRRAEARGG